MRRNHDAVSHRIDTVSTPPDALGGLEAMGESIFPPDEINMAEPREARLKLAREHANFRSASGAAQHFGWTESTYRSHENGTRAFGIDDARRYAHAFGVSLDWLFYNKGNMTPPDHGVVTGQTTRAAPPRLAANARLLPQPIAPSRRKLPVYGQAMAGPQGALAFDGTTLDMVPCPEMLDDVADAYAVYVHGDSMEPRYFAGETVYVNPARPPRVGDFVLAQVEDHGSVVGYVKRLKARSGDGVVLEQFNPPCEMTFSAQVVQALHRIVATASD